MLHGLVQDVTCDGVTIDDEAAYWYKRYQLRERRDATAGPRGEGTPDVPDFLEGVKDTILTTGDAILVMRYTLCHTLTNFRDCITSSRRARGYHGCTVSIPDHYQATASLGLSCFWQGYIAVQS